MVTSSKKLQLFAEATYLYFLQGLPYGFQVKYLPLLLRNQGHGLSVISLLNVISLPWILKFTWAGLFDRYGGTGRIWTSGCLGILSLAAASLCYFSNFVLAILMLLFLSFFSASLDIAVDALVIRNFEAKDLGYCNVGHIVGYKIGILFGGGILTALNSHISPQYFFFVIAIAYGISAAYLLKSSSQLFKSEGRHEEKSSKTEGEAICKWTLLKMLLSPKQIWLILFVLSYKMGEQGFISMYPLQLIDKGVTLGRIGVTTGIFGQLCSIAGSSLGGILISRFRCEVKNLLFKVASIRFIMIVIYSSFLQDITDHFMLHIAFECTFQLLAGMITTITFTTMMMSSKLMPRSVHASHFTILSAFEVFGKLAMKSFSGAIAEKVGFSNFFLICCIVDGFVVFLTLVGSSMLKSSCKPLNEAKKDS